MGIATLLQTGMDRVEVGIMVKDKPARLLGIQFPIVKSAFTILGLKKRKGGAIAPPSPIYNMWGLVTTGSG